MQDLAGRVVVITGAGRGLGAAFAMVLADARCELVLCGRNPAALAETADLIAGRAGHRPDCVELDLADAASVAQAVEQITGLKPRVDILINNGAMWLEARDTPFADGEVLGVVNAAVTGSFLLTHGLRGLMEASEAPDVVTIGSVSGLPNAALQTVSVPFYAAKRAQLALADGLRQTYRGSKFRSILVNPPYLDDARPNLETWQEAALRRKGERATSRDVVEAAIYALTRPRHVSLTIDMDADEGGIFG